MLPALVLSLMMQVSPKTAELPPAPNPVKGYDGWWIYTTSMAGYDSTMAYKYKRKVFVVVGPPESLVAGQPAPEVYIRYALNVGVQEIVSVKEEDDICNPDAPVYIEYGGELFHECPPWGHQ